MAAIPEQSTLTPDQAINQLVIMLAAMQVAACVHLSPTRSVNLRHVSRYEHLEELKDDGTSYKPKRFSPCIFFGASEDHQWLSTEPAEGGGPSENEIFRKAWQNFAHVTSGGFAVLNHIFPQASTPAAVPAVEQGSEVAS